MFKNDVYDGAKKPDRRTQRTRRQLSGAIVDLIKEKRFDDITVQNVIDRAYTPESMDEIFRRIIKPSFKSVLRIADAKS